MAAKKPKQDDPAESKRFIEIAREVETDESPDSFDKAFNKVTSKPKAGPARRSGKRGAT